MEQPGDVTLALFNQLEPVCGTSSFGYDSWRVLLPA